MPFHLICAPQHCQHKLAPAFPSGPILHYATDDAKVTHCGVKTLKYQYDWLENAGCVFIQNDCSRFPPERLVECYHWNCALAIAFSRNEVKCRINHSKYAPMTNQYQHMQTILSNKPKLEQVQTTCSRTWLYSTPLSKQTRRKQEKEQNNIPVNLSISLKSKHKQTSNVLRHCWWNVLQRSAIIVQMLPIATGINLMETNYGSP